MPQQSAQMNVKQLKQELIQRGLPTDGLKAALIERLEQAMQQPKKNKRNTTSNEDYHTLTARAASDKLLIAERRGRSSSSGRHSQLC